MSTPAAGLQHGEPLSAVDQFLQSTRDSLRPHTNTGEGALLALAFVLVLGLAFWCLHLFRRKRTADRAFTRLMTARQISAQDATLLRQMARAAKVTPLRMATQLDTFERATATAVQDIPPKLIGEEADVLGAIRLLRRHLGFSKLPEHFSLRTTRELMPEMPIEIQGAHANVIGVTEAFFSVRAPAVRGLRVGDRVELTLAHAQEARYAVSCELLASERITQEGPPDVKLSFGHDESPRRLQRREFVRVAARGPMMLAREGAPEPLQVSLVDISVGGAAVDSAGPLHAGDGFQASFHLNAMAFAGIPATVIDSYEQADGTHRVRVKFGRLSSDDDQRLNVAVLHHTANPIDPE